MEKIQKRINEIFDSGLKGEDLVIALENEIKELQPYHHDEQGSIEACGITSPVELRIVGSGSFSKIVEKIEKSVTKRKLAFILFRKFVEAEEAFEDDTVASKSHVELERSSRLERKSSLESTIRELMGFDPESSERTPDNCNETDDSECWNCKFNRSCKRKDSFK